METLGRHRALVTRFVVLIMVAVVFIVAMFAILAGLGRAAVGVGSTTFERGLEPLRIPQLPERSTIYAADGSVMGSVYLDYNREIVGLGQVRPQTRRAVLAVEDHRFYEHGPVDLRSIVRAFLANLRAGAAVQGGSTITQQLVKDTVGGDQVTLARKIREAVDAYRVERTFTKTRILQMYLNDVYLGHGAYGLAAAAQFYFAERVRDLTLAQAALLAGMIRSPDGYDPVAHPLRARARRDFVLRRMRMLGWVQPARARRAMTTPIRLSATGRDGVTPGPTSFWEQFVIERFLADPAFGATVADRRRPLFQGGCGSTRRWTPRCRTRPRP